MSQPCSLSGTSDLDLSSPFELIVTDVEYTWIRPSGFAGRTPVQNSAYVSRTAARSRSTSRRALHLYS